MTTGMCKHRCDYIRIARIYDATTVCECDQIPENAGKLPKLDGNFTNFSNSSENFEDHGFQGSDGGGDLQFYFQITGVYQKREN